MSRPITGTPPLNRKEWDKFVKRINQDVNKKVGPVPTPKLKYAEEKIRRMFGV